MIYKCKYQLFVRNLLIAGLLLAVFSAESQPWQDMEHYSEVFGKEKKYRIYLPKDYLQSEKKYPVIYFFHGWGGRSFSGGSANLEYEKIGTLIDKYQIILVMWDGSMEEDEPRPYNVGNHHDVKYDIEMKDYFPELVSQIDHTFRTKTDRNHRGIIGFSMGGFMSFYLAGKYPGMVSVAVNIVGSPEFFVGSPDNHTFYQQRYTLENLRDVGLFQINRTNCPMAGLNDEVAAGADWYELKNYTYQKQEGEHNIDIPGETKVFESAIQFVVNQFINPVSLQKKWSHSDLCGVFEKWNYSVKSNKDEPGFLVLHNVDETGFSFYTRKWLPDGPSIKNCQANISTAPLYEPGNEYDVRIFNLKENKLERIAIKADDHGRLNFNLGAEGFEVGISKKTAQPEFAALKYSLFSNRKYLRINREEELIVDIFNRTGALEPEKKLIVRLSSADTSLTISLPEQEIVFSENQDILNTKPFKIFSLKNPPADGSPAWIRLNVEINYGSQQFNDWLLLPVFYDVPEFKNIQVDDGRAVFSSLNPGDSKKLNQNLVYGFGNGDGMVSAGERIILYENGQRLRLYSDNPYVVADEEVLVDEMLPGRWPDGYTLSSVVKIAEDCPPGHEIEFQAHYETKTFMPMYREVKWGKVKIVTKPKTKTE
jgi:hypothetical protein